MAQTSGLEFCMAHFFAHFFGATNNDIKYTRAANRVIWMPTQIDRNPWPQALNIGIAISTPNTPLRYTQVGLLYYCLQLFSSPKNTLGRPFGTSIKLVSEPEKLTWKRRSE